MFNTSILRAKIKRSNISFKNTFLFDESNDMSGVLEKSPMMALEEGEEIIISYVKSENYKWVLTNHKIYIFNGLDNILLTDLIKVDVENIKGNPDSKTTNTELTLFTNEEARKIFVEEGTWHLFYNVFRFIVNNNKVNSPSSAKSD